MQALRELGDWAAALDRVVPQRRRKHDGVTKKKKTKTAQGDGAGVAAAATPEPESSGTPSLE